MRFSYPLPCVSFMLRKNNRLLPAFSDSCDIRIFRRTAPSCPKTRALCALQRRAYAFMVNGGLTPYVLSQPPDCTPQCGAGHTPRKCPVRSSASQLKYRIYCVNAITQLLRNQTAARLLYLRTTAISRIIADSSILSVFRIL